MTRILQAVKQAPTENGDLLQLDYYLLSEYQEDWDMEQYGVEVTLTTGNQQESDQVLRVTPIQQSIESLIDQLAEQTVTPSALREILLDIL